MTKDVATSAPHVEEMRVASEDYNELNAIAHRRFEHDFVAPALTSR